MGRRATVRSGAGRGRALLVAAALGIAAGLARAEGELTGFLAAELRLFPQPRLDRRQHETNLSVVARPEYYHAWDDGRQSVTVVPFVRLDQGDSERTHFDVRQLVWLQVGSDWELRLGVDRVFWGVTESLHLVDVINQTDLVENLDGEDRLGQPMAALSLIRDWGTVDLYLLPGFRERTFAGSSGRPRSTPRVEPGLVRFESDAENLHVDWAARWSAVIGDFDVGLSHFRGTSRDPRLEPARTLDGETVLAPVYDLVHQSGLDLQLTRGQWLWKLEAIRRSGQGDTFVALVGGFEYTRVGVLGTAIDVGLLGEYLFDSRGSNAPQPFEDDVFAGVRIALNDAQSSVLLAGVTLDRGADTRLFTVEASRRLGNRWTVELEARLFRDVAEADPLLGLRNDDYIQLQIARFF